VSRNGNEAGTKDSASAFRQGGPPSVDVEMGRPHRIQAPEAVYHVTARGVRRLTVYQDAIDYAKFEALLATVVRRREWALYSYCQMPNHYHLLLRTPDADISDGMCWLNGVYARWFNRRHGHQGHVFEARFHAVLVRSQFHLSSLACYIPANPVRAKLCRRPADWRWSSYRATLGAAKTGWLESDWLLEQFGQERGVAIAEYERFVEAQLVRAGRVRVPGTGTRPGGTAGLDFSA
jgi:putative transposase